MSEFFSFEKLKKVAMEYKSMPKEENGICDSLHIRVDFEPNGCGALVVMRRDGSDTYVINQFINDEALELYNKLIGK